MYTFSHLKEGIRFVKRRIKIRTNGLQKYSGSAKDVAKKIITACFNGEFFQVSTGNFSEFYIRDFGICVEALCKLGYKKEVRKTLQYCLNIYARENKISTTITPEHRTLDVFDYAPDSLAFLLYSLRVSNNTDLVEVYRPFLETQIAWYHENVLDVAGLVREDQFFSSMKDNAKRKSSCYDNCMTFMIQQEAKRLKLKCGFAKIRIDKKIIATFWNGAYFNDDLYSNYVAGDANVFPFWCGVVEDKKKFNSVLEVIQKEGLDAPFPLRYTKQKVVNHHLTFFEVFADNYEGNSIWAHLGLCFMDVVKKYDQQLLKRYVKLYQDKICEYQNFLEVYNEDGTPYSTLFYYCDDSMVWVSKWLMLSR